MNNLLTLYRYELKKILSQKLFKITFCLCILCIPLTILSSLIGNYYVDGKVVDTHYHMFLVNKAYSLALTDRHIDTNLLQEMTEAYKQVPLTNGVYTLSNEYQTYARPYSEICNLVRSWTGMDIEDIQKWTPNEKMLYLMRQKNLESIWNQNLLQDTEKAFWREQETRLKMPFIYSYHEGYTILLESLLTFGIIILIFIAISLSSLFPNEHIRRTDQLILCSQKGKTTLYWAKILAGISISVLSSLLISTLAFILSLSIFGTTGFDAHIQLLLGDYSYPLTLGKATLIAYGLLIIASVLFGIFVMILSEFLHSSLFTLALSTGLILAGSILYIPDEYRLLGQLWNTLPTSFLTLWNIFETRTFIIANHCFVTWRIISLIYLLLSILLILVGKTIYRRYQVSGR